MYFADLELENWGPFRGEHYLELGPGAFSVTGQWDHDRENRSNFSGKSWLLGALYFLVTGERPEEADLEDRWITDGETTGRVAGVLAHEGRPVLKIVRERRRGSSTLCKAQLVGDEPAARAAAERLIFDTVGLSGEDLFATWLIRQKKLSWFITAQPTERVKIVREWLPDIEKLAEAEGSVDLSGALEKLAGARTSMVGLQSRLSALEGAATRLAETRESLERLNSYELEIQTELGVASRALEKPGVEAAQRERAEEDREELASVKAAISRIGLELAQLEKELAGEPPDDTLLRTKESDARREVETARTVARGEFDGTCPVSRKGCPISEEINAGAADGKRRLALAQTTLSRAEDARREASKKVEARRSQEDRKRALEGEQGHLQGRLPTLTRRVADWETAGAYRASPRGDERALRDRLARAEEATENCEEWRRAGLKVLYARDLDVERAEETEAELRKVEAEVKRLEETVEVRRLARLVLGRGGAQRDYAVSRLGKIEAAANVVLAGAGVDQKVGLQWGREAQDLARHCESCGHPYPKRQGAKICERCGAERGPNVVPELIVPIAHRSGGGDDLAGLSVHVGAAAWLTPRRKSRWSSLIVDEPHGALDPAHRDAVWRVLLGLVEGSFGIRAEQVIAVSHSPDAVSRMPRRILVEARNDGSGSSVRVLG